MTTRAGYSTSHERFPDNVGVNPLRSQAPDFCLVTPAADPFLRQGLFINSRTRSIFAKLYFHFRVSSLDFFACSQFPEVCPV